MLLPHLSLLIVRQDHGCFLQAFCDTLQHAQVVASMVVVDGRHHDAGGSEDEDAGTGVIALNRADIFSYR